MVPEEYHEFFVATAGVAGALIGLLFVAISVNPGGMNRKSSVRLRTRPAAALSAFLDPLLVSLLALLPGTAGSGTVVVACAGLAAMTALAIFTVAEGRRDGWRMVGRSLLSLAVQVGMLIVQLVAALRLQSDPTHTASWDRIGITVVVLFSAGIDRAWEFVGAQHFSLVSSVVQTVQRVHDGPDKGDDDQAAGDSSTPTTEEADEPRPNVGS